MCSLRVSIEGFLGQFVEQRVGLAVEHAIPLLDRGLAGMVRAKRTLASAGWTEKQGVFVARNERAGGQIEDQAADSSSC